MISTLKSIRLAGIYPIPTIVECEVSKGIGIHIVGLTDIAVKEGLLRTVTAMQSQGYRIPGKRIVVNIAPADIVKTGSHYDLPMTLAMLAASGEENLPELDKWIVLGEMSLDAHVRSVPGCIQAVQAALEDDDIKGVIIPRANGDEVAPVFANAIPVYAVDTLTEAIDIVKGGQGYKTAWEEYLAKPAKTIEENDSRWEMLTPSMRRSLEIAAAGGHGILMIGAPGSGKASAARELVTLLPRMSVSEIEEVAAIYSVHDGSMKGRVGKVCETRPFRAPHISCSMAALLGGGAGSSILPGEISLAHNGVLYIDEIAEAPKRLQEGLRIPLEDHKVTITRLKSRVEIPADCQVVASTNPCPCGYYGEGDKCTCTPAQRAAYMSRLDCTLVDNLTMQLWCHQLQPTTGSLIGVEDKDAVRERVAIARDRQKHRYQGRDFSLNDRIPNEMIGEFCSIGEDEKELLDRLVERLNLSARSYNRIIRLARTIADLDGSSDIEGKHIAEAASYRFLDRMPF